MGAYQSQATEPNLVPMPGMKLPSAVNTLPKCDFYVSLNAHLGRPEVLTAWMDPAITDELDPASVDPGLSMFNPQNGPPYSSDFIDRYRAAPNPHQNVPARACPDSVATTNGGSEIHPRRRHPLV